MKGFDYNKFLTELLIEKVGADERARRKTYEVINNYYGDNGYYNEERLGKLEALLKDTFFHGRNSDAFIRLEPLVMKVALDLGFPTSLRYSPYLRRLKEILVYIKNFKPDTKSLDLNTTNLEQLEELYGENTEKMKNGELKLNDVNMGAQSGNYDIIEVKNFEQAKQIGDYSGQRHEDGTYSGQLCYTQGSGTWENYTRNGENTVYALLRKDWKDVPCVHEGNTPYDNYGLSMIFLFINPFNELVYSNTRWNHRTDGKGPTDVDQSFTKNSICDILGITTNDFELIFKPKSEVSEYIKLVFNNLQNPEVPLEDIFEVIERSSKYTPNFEKEWWIVRLKNRPTRDGYYNVLLPNERKLVYPKTWFSLLWYDKNHNLIVGTIYNLYVYIDVNNFKIYTEEQITSQEKDRYTIISTSHNGVSRIKSTITNKENFLRPDKTLISPKIWFNECSDFSDEENMGYGYVDRESFLIDYNGRFTKISKDILKKGDNLEELIAQLNKLIKLDGKLIRKVGGDIYTTDVEDCYMLSFRVDNLRYDNIRALYNKNTKQLITPWAGEIYDNNYINLGLIGLYLLKPYKYAILDSNGKLYTYPDTFKILTNVTNKIIKNRDIESIRSRREFYDNKLEGCILIRVCGLFNYIKDNRLLFPDVWFSRIDSGSLGKNFVEGGVREDGGEVKDYYLDLKNGQMLDKSQVNEYFWSNISKELESGIRLEEICKKHDIEVENITSDFYKVKPESGRILGTNFGIKNHNNFELVFKGYTPVRKMHQSKNIEENKAINVELFDDELQNLMRFDGSFVLKENCYGILQNIEGIYLICYEYDRDYENDKRTMKFQFFNILTNKFYPETPVIGILNSNDDYIETNINGKKVLITGDDEDTSIFKANYKDTGEPLFKPQNRIKTENILKLDDRAFKKMLVEMIEKELVKYL